MNEGDERSVRAWPRRLVDQPDAARLQLRERRAMSSTRSVM